MACGLSLAAAAFPSNLVGFSKSPFVVHATKKAHLIRRAFEKKAEYFFRLSRRTGRRFLPRIAQQAFEKSLAGLGAHACEAPRQGGAPLLRNRLQPLADPALHVLGQLGQPPAQFRRARILAPGPPASINVASGPFSHLIESVADLAAVPLSHAIHLLLGPVRPPGLDGLVNVLLLRGTQLGPDPVLQLRDGSQVPGACGSTRAPRTFPTVDAGAITIDWRTPLATPFTCRPLGPLVAAFTGHRWSGGTLGAIRHGVGIESTPAGRLAIVEARASLATIARSFTAPGFPLEGADMVGDPFALLG